LVTTLYTLISCDPRLAVTEVPLPVAPVHNSVQLYEPEPPRPGTSANLNDRVEAPVAATTPMTTPSLRGPAQ
jgi:hypothetical protein